MKTRKRYFQVLICLLISVGTAHASNNIALVRTAMNTIEVQLVNSEAIAGVQFS